jgi:hypothetical protein
LRFWQMLECRRTVAARVSMLSRVSFLTTTVVETGIPSFAKEGNPLSLNHLLSNNRSLRSSFGGQHREASASSITKRDDVSDAYG